MGPDCVSQQCVVAAAVAHQSCEGSILGGELAHSSCQVCQFFIKSCRCCFPLSFLFNTDAVCKDDGTIVLNNKPSKVYIQNRQPPKNLLGEICTFFG